MTSCNTLSGDGAMGVPLSVPPPSRVSNNIHIRDTAVYLRTDTHRSMSSFGGFAHLEAIVSRASAPPHSRWRPNFASRPAGLSRYDLSLARFSHGGRPPKALRRIYCRAARDPLRAELRLLLAMVSIAAGVECPAQVSGRMRPRQCSAAATVRAHILISRDMLVLRQRARDRDAEMGLMRAWTSRAPVSLREGRTRRTARNSRQLSWCGQPPCMVTRTARPGRAGGFGLAIVSGVVLGTKMLMERPPIGPSMPHSFVAETSGAFWPSLQPAVAIPTARQRQPRPSRGGASRLLPRGQRRRHNLMAATPPMWRPAP